MGNVRPPNSTSPPGATRRATWRERYKRLGNPIVPDRTRAVNPRRPHLRGRMTEFILDPWERLGLPRREALRLSPAEALAALYYYPARAALIATALRKAPAP